MGLVKFFISLIHRIALTNLPFLCRVSQRLTSSQSCLLW